MSMPGVDLSSYDNSRYKPGSLVRRAFWHVMSIAFFENPIPFPYSLKRWILRAFGARVGGRVVIKPGVKIKYPWFLEAGSNVWIGERVWIDNLAPVKIGGNACISQGACIMTGNHNYKKRTFDLIVEEVSMEDGVWVGAKAVVCPGVRLGSHSVMTAGSVVTADTLPYTVYKGNPAAAVRQRSLEE